MIIITWTNLKVEENESNFRVGTLISYSISFSYFCSIAYRQWIGDSPSGYIVK